MDLNVLVIYMKVNITFWSSTLTFLIPNNFRVTILRPKRMVAECWLTDDPLLMDVGGVLTLLGVANKES